MSMIFFTFRAQTRAKQGAVMLKKAGVSVQMGKTPGILARNGCGYGLWIPADQAKNAASLLRRGQIAFERTYRLDDGRFQEVDL